MPAYARPVELQDALRLLAREPRRILAGGTDFYPTRVGKPLDEDVLDVTALNELRGIRATASGWRIGAATTWSEVIESTLPPVFDALKLAAREIGGRQIQNAATLGGNLCNASPAADGVPALLALDAAVEVRSLGETRLVPLDRFVVGPRQTTLEPGEMLTAILVPKPRHEAASHFLKLGARRYLVISVAMAAAAIERENGRVTAARVAVGACSPVARRLPELERDLCEGKSRVRAAHLAPLSPIDDVRGSREYRNQAVLVLVQRLLDRILA